MFTIYKPWRRLGSFEEMRKMRGKQKYLKDNEDDKDLVAKMGKGKKLGYSIRSKDK